MTSPRFGGLFYFLAVALLDWPLAGAAEGSRGQGPATVRQPLCAGKRAERRALSGERKLSGSAVSGLVLAAGTA